MVPISVGHITPRLCGCTLMATRPTTLRLLYLNFEFRISNFEFRNAIRNSHFEFRKGQFSGEYNEYIYLNFNLIENARVNITITTMVIAIRKPARNIGHNRPHCLENKRIAPSLFVVYMYVCTLNHSLSQFPSHTAQCQHQIGWRP